MALDDRREIVPELIRRHRGNLEARIPVIGMDHEVGAPVSPPASQAPQRRHADGADVAPRQTAERLLGPAHDVEAEPGDAELDVAFAHREVRDPAEMDDRQPNHVAGVVLILGRR